MSSYYTMCSSPPTIAYPSTLCKIDCNTVTIQIHETDGEYLTFAQLEKIFSCCCQTRRIITVFTTASRCTISLN